jgi:hypothetical protein
MKKIVILLAMFLVLGNCGPGPIPNPGFRLYCEIAVRQGGILIPAPVIGARTTGSFSVEGLPPITGEVRSFLQDSGPDGIIDVNGGRAAALWYIQATANWEGCTGMARFFEFTPGHGQEVVCGPIGINLPLAPGQISSSAQPIEIQTNIYAGLNTTYGMPIFQFEDYQGRLVGTTTATQVNGTDVRLSSSALQNKPGGTYLVKVYNALAPGDDLNKAQPFDFATILVVDCTNQTDVEHNYTISGSGGSYSHQGYITTEIVGNQMHLIIDNRGTVPGFSTVQPIPPDSISISDGNGAIFSRGGMRIVYPGGSYQPPPVGTGSMNVSQFSRGGILYGRAEVWANLNGRTPSSYSSAYNRQQGTSYAYPNIRSCP